MEMQAEHKKIIALESLAEQALLAFSKEKMNNDTLLDQKGKVNDRVLIQYFNLIDEDNSNDIDKKELEQLLTMLKIVPTKEKIDAMLNEFDTDGNQKINQDEFIKGM